MIFSRLESVELQQTAVSVSRPHDHTDRQTDRQTLSEPPWPRVMSVTALADPDRPTISADSAFATSSNHAVTGRAGYTDHK